jgi:hypothetical protein
MRRRVSLTQRLGTCDDSGTTRRDVLDDDDVRETPPAVVGAVALGTAPLPFLAVYTVLFLVHGSVHPVQPPDVTSTKQGEFIAGWIALGVFIVTAVSLLWLVNRRRRWPFVIVQLGILATAIDFLVDDTAGGQFISLLIVITSALALVLSFAPQSWEHVHQRAPSLLARLYGAGSGSRRKNDPGSTSLPKSTEPAPVEPASLRRRRSNDDSSNSFS